MAILRICIYMVSHLLLGRKLSISCKGLSGIKVISKYEVNPTSSSQSTVLKSNIPYRVQ